MWNSPLTFVQVSPVVMLGATVDYLLYQTFFAGETTTKEPRTSNDATSNSVTLNWRVPAFMSMGFGIFSIYTAAQEGLLGFYHNQAQNLWGNQVWFDVMFSVSLYWFALLPRARRLGMPILPWLVYNISTASIGGLHFYARILYLEKQELQEGRAGNINDVSNYSTLAK